VKGVILWIQGFALAIGGPGLFIIAFLDSSILSLPEINDILIVWMVTKHKERMLYYAAMATLGSIAGCFVLYAIGRKGGEAFLRRRFHARHIDRALGLYRRFGLLAVLVPAILPPPAPFKIFVLLAGVAQMSVYQFALAVGLGRGFRYFGEGLLALWYGEQTIAFIRQHGRPVAIAVAVLVLAGAVAYVWWSRRQPSQAGPEDQHHKDDGSARL
jgi:membrane protein YqaA with SNARE-associated domain